MRYQIAAIRANAATLKLQEANLTLARKEHDRQVLLTTKQAGSQDDLDQRVAALQVAREQVNAADQALRQMRVMLGLSPTAADPENVPDDLPETFPGVLYAVSGAAQTLSQLGVSFDLAKMTPTGLGERVGSLKADAVIEQSPGVQAAQARVRQAQAVLGGHDYSPGQPYDHPAVVKAQKELEEAELQAEVHRDPGADRRLRQPPVRSTPATHVQAGQGLLADPALERRVDRRQFQGDATGRPDDRPAGGDLHVDAYPGRVVPRPGRRLRPGDRGGLVAAAAGERHRQLRQGACSGCRCAST